MQHAIIESTDALLLVQILTILRDVATTDSDGCPIGRNTVADMLIEL